MTATPSSSSAPNLDKSETVAASSSEEKSANAQIPEFLMKTFKLLEKGAHVHLIRWSDHGKSFLIEDAVEFARFVLPRYFKHQNISSYVRQLNKYGFHKVKRATGDPVWEFSHPFFQRNRPDLLHSVKRTVPSASSSSTMSAMPPDTNMNEGGASAKQDLLEMHVSQLTQLTGQMSAYIQQLTKSFQWMTEEMIQYRRTVGQQEQLLQSFIQQLVFTRQQQTPINVSAPQQPMSQPSQQPSSLKNSDSTMFLHSISNLNKDRMEKVNVLAHKMQEMTAHLRAQSELTASHASNVMASPLLQSAPASNSQKSTVVQQPIAPATSRQIAPDLMTPASGAVWSSVDPTSASLTSSSESNKSHRSISVSSSSSSASATRNNHLEMLRDMLNAQHNADSLTEQGANASSSAVSIKAPTWTVPPKVLLVEDDAMCRRLSSRLLRVFGCNIDVAVDGLAAVQQMNLGKYDIVLMDIVMPKLDGISATHHIRQFDQFTPIISMTSNTTENDCRTYIKTGMTDILAKPVSKASLFQMLERYCSHLSAASLSGLIAQQQQQAQLMSQSQARDSSQNSNNSPGLSAALGLLGSNEFLSRAPLFSQPSTSPISFQNITMIDFDFEPWLRPPSVSGTAQVEVLPDEQSNNLSSVFNADTFLRQMQEAAPSHTSASITSDGENTVQSLDELVGVENDAETEAQNRQNISSLKDHQIDSQQFRVFSKLASQPSVGQFDFSHYSATSHPIMTEIASNSSTPFPGHPSTGLLSGMFYGPPLPASSDSDLSTTKRQQDDSSPNNRKRARA